MEGRTVAGGRVVVESLLESGAASARFRAHIDVDPQQKRLLTLGQDQTVPHDQVTRRLALAMPGVAPLEFIGPVDQPDEVGWLGACMVEVEPRGRRADELGPLSDASAASLGLQILEVVGRAHAAGLLLLGIRPELVYCDAAAGLVGLVPRAPIFLQTARPASHGRQVLPDLYRAPEDQFGLAPAPRSDVFALCATLFALTAGRHPFGAHAGEQIHRIAAGQVAPHPGRLGSILAAGLAPDPARRPEVAALSAQLRGL